MPENITLQISGADHLDLATLEKTLPPNSSLSIQSSGQVDQHQEFLTTAVLIKLAYSGVGALATWIFSRPITISRVIKKPDGTEETQSISFGGMSSAKIKDRLEEFFRLEDSNS